MKATVDDHSEDLTGFEARLLAQLKEMVAEQVHTRSRNPVGTAPPRQRSWTAPVAVATAIVALLVGALIVYQPRSSAWAVVALPDGSVQVTMSDDFEDPQALVSQLRAHAIAVAVLPVLPSSPDLVGQVDFAGPLEDEPGLDVPARGMRGATEFILDPAVFAGTIELHLAAEAATMADAFAPGEILHGRPCSPDEPLPPGDVEDTARDAGIQVLWRTVEADGTIRPASTRPEGRVHLALVSHSDQPPITALQVAVLPLDVGAPAAPGFGCVSGK